MMLEFTPIIIIGAGRSGTNMLRDALCKVSGFSTWDCDEINPIWRHGNTNHPDDLFGEEQVTPEIKSYLRSKFVAQWKRLGKPEYLVEKTCANSLRVSFIASIFPEAKFLYIVRNGEDVTASASKRWRGEMEIPSLPYYISKIRNTPISDLPHYGWRFIQSRADIYLGKKEHMSFWGPQFPGLKDLPQDTPLMELCAEQWASCVSSSDKSFAKLSADTWMKVRYEDFVATPKPSMKSVFEFLKIELSDQQLDKSVSDISPRSVGKARKSNNEFTEKVHEILAPSLIAHKYKN